MNFLLLLFLVFFAPLLLFVGEFHALDSLAIVSSQRRVWSLTFYQYGWQLPLV
jgi:hypothetical protein